MSKTYLIVRAYDPNPFNRRELIDFLVDKNAIDDWSFCLPYSIFVKSTHDAKYLSEQLEEKYGTKVIHFITQIHKDDYFGRLPEEYWDIIMDLD